jgi:GNAT superfamily N-acetyltransferase
MINPLDTNDDRLVARVHQLLLACHEEASPRVPYREEAETAAYLRNPPPFERRSLWIAGDVEGFARLAIIDGSRSAWLELAVAHRSRRQGIGRALLDASVAEARSHGCTAVGGRHTTPAGAAFARAAGAVDARQDITSLLELGAVELDLVPVDGYRLESWIGAAPGELVESYAAARNAINDAPSYNDDEDYPWTVEMVRGEEEMLAQRGRELRVTTALDARGEVAAFTELRLSTVPGTVASTEDTATVATHRHRGLAAWVKAESLRLLRTERPNVRLVATTNAAENAAILALNRRLGFERAAIATTASLTLAGS